MLAAMLARPARQPPYQAPANTAGQNDSRQARPDPRWMVDPARVGSTHELVVPGIRAIAPLPMRRSIGAAPRG